MKNYYFGGSRKSVMGEKVMKRRYIGEIAEKGGFEQFADLREGLAVSAQGKMSPLDLNIVRRQLA